MKITDDFCEGGALFTQSGEGSRPKVRGTQALQVIADDLKDLASGLQITGAAIPYAAGDPPTKAEFDALVDRVNAIQTALNAVASVTLRTVNAGS